MASLYLYAGFPQIDAQPVGVPAVVFHQLLQGPERGAPGDEESALVQLSDAVVLDGVAVPHGEGVVVAAGLGVADQVGAVLVLGEEQFLLCLHALDLAKVPSGKKERNILSHNQSTHK